MRMCFVKGAYTTPLSWESLRYPGAKKLLDSLPFGSLDFSLMVEHQADTWVISMTDVAKGGGLVSRKKAVQESAVKLERLHRNIVRVAKIPWGDYDCVISYDPIIPKDIIKRHPRVLWCYKEMSVNHKRAENALQANHPHGGYDLFLEERLRATDRLERLPQVIAFPHVESADIMRGLIVPRNEPAVFIDPRNIPQREDGRKRMKAEFSKICGLSIRHAPFPEFDTMLPKFTPALVSGARKKIIRTTEYLNLVGSCKYHLSWRKRLVGGQALVEAVGLGLILIAPSRSPYSPLLCHQICLTVVGEPPTIGLSRIARIEKDSALQNEILAHQDRVLRELFWERPLRILEKALEMKRK